jgi:hypothetical protein
VGVAGTDSYSVGAQLVSGEQTRSVLPVPAADSYSLAEQVVQAAQADWFGAPV